jgi:hypothetical protein
MNLFNPTQPNFSDFDTETIEIFQKTIEFFESKGLAEMKREDQEATWPDDFFKYIDESKFISKFLTPSEYGETGCRYDVS